MDTSMLFSLLFVVSSLLSLITIIIVMYGYRSMYILYLNMRYCR